MSYFWFPGRSSPAAVSSEVDAESVASYAVIKSMIYFPYKVIWETALK